MCLICGATVATARPSYWKCFTTLSVPSLTHLHTQLYSILLHLYKVKLYLPFKSNHQSYRCCSSYLHTNGAHQMHWRFSVLPKDTTCDGVLLESNHFFLAMTNTLDIFAISGWATSLRLRRKRVETGAGRYHQQKNARQTVSELQMNIFYLTLSIKTHVLAADSLCELLTYCKIISAVSPAVPVVLFCHHSVWCCPFQRDGKCEEFIWECPPVHPTPGISQTLPHLVPLGFTHLFFFFSLHTSSQTQHLHSPSL